MRRLGSFLCSAVLALSACGNSDENKGAAGGGNAGAGTSGSANASGGSSGSGVAVGFGGAAGSSTSTAGSNGIDKCVEAAQSGKLVPLDIFIMLDVSGSMLETTSAMAQAPTKWTAVKRALQAFVTDPKSEGIGVGIQYFPLREPTVPATCTSDAQCGNFGPCFLRFCKNGVPGIYPCASNADCITVDGEDAGPCVPLTYCYGADATAGLCHDTSECDGASPLCAPFLECSGDTTYACPQAGRSCGTDNSGKDLGTCRSFSPTSTCVRETACGATTYANPAVDVATLPAASAALVASINAQEPQPTSLTPTRPALLGAIEKAKAWAGTHPDHTVVVLLATDGLPTECILNPDADPSGVAEVRVAAAQGVSGMPLVQTFVIGVFGPDDTGARMNLNQIATAGGTKTAFMVDTSGDVTAQFLDALNAIRSSELSCEYQLPTPPPDQDLDFARVNVDFSMAGASERLFRVANAGACDATGGWYYDADVDSGKVATKILICPSTCERFSKAQDGEVKVALGCQTKVR